MEAISEKNPPDFEPIVTDFPSQAKGVRFKREILVQELLSLGHAKITPQIASLVGQEVEAEIHKRKIQFLSTELISELVEGKLEELGLIRAKKPLVNSLGEKSLSSGPFIKNNQDLHPEILEVLAPPDGSVKTEGGLKQGVRRISPSFSDMSMHVLRRHVLIKNEKGEVIESPEEMLTRVARAVSAADIRYSPTEQLINLETEFYNLMAEKSFFPHPQILANAGRALGLLTSCFILPLKDSMESIFETMKQTAIIHKCGGSVGISFSPLRPKNDAVLSNHGFSSGPVSFMRVYNSAAEAVKQGGKNAGVNGALLSIDHPDIIDFLTAKEGEARLTEVRLGEVPFKQFSLATGLSEAFMRALADDNFYSLVNPRTGEAEKKIKASKVMKHLTQQIAKGEETVLLFADRVEAHNPTPLHGRLSGFDPSSHQPFLPFETCTLGALNLATVVDDGRIMWEKIKSIVHQAVHFLDNAIEVNHYPLPEIEEEVKAGRKIGLGVMGWADLLIKLHIPYASHEAETLAGQMMSFIQNEAQNASMALAKKRGSFPLFDESVYADRGLKRRNAIVTAIFPTPLLSFIADCSPGIEPVSSFVREVQLKGSVKVLWVQDDFAAEMKKQNLYSEDFVKRLIKEHSLKSMSEIPKKEQNLFAVADDISPEGHLKIQAAFQKHAENSVYKEIILPPMVEDEEIRRLIFLAYHMGLKTLMIRKRENSQCLGENLEMFHDGKAYSPSRITDDPKINLNSRENPQVMKGITRRIQTDCGELYLTLNEGEGELCEVLARAEQTSNCTASHVEAISRLISLSLKAGISPELITLELEGILCPEHNRQNEGIAHSYPDAIARALKEKVDI